MIKVLKKFCAVSESFEEQRIKFLNYSASENSTSDILSSNDTNFSTARKIRYKEMESLGRIFSISESFYGMSACDLNAEISMAVCTNKMQQLQCDATTKHFQASYQCSREYSTLGLSVKWLSLRLSISRSVVRASE